MNTNSLLTQKRRLLLLGGLAAGFLNGLLGAGGGIVILWALSMLNPIHSAEDIRNNFAAAIACILPMTALSALLYTDNANLDWTSLSGMILPAALGGISGALLLGKINTNLLKKIFALLVIFAGIRMCMR